MNVNGKKVLENARSRGQAVCGFDAFNMESAQAIVRTAERLAAPLFLQVCIPSAEYMGMEMAWRILATARRAGGPDTCIHLDHGLATSSVEDLRRAIDLGFESVMVDGSVLPLEENIGLVKQIVVLAHSKGVCVEGELGRVSRNVHASREEIDLCMTDPEQAGYFVERTGLDYLAVSVGSVSGFFQGKVNLDLERLSRIREKVQVPLVFHGGTGIPADQLREAIKLGIAKINIAHGVRKAFLSGISAYLAEKPDEFDPRKVLARGMTHMESFAEMKIRAISFSE